MIVRSHVADGSPPGVVGAGVAPRPHERLLGDVLGGPRVARRSSPPGRTHGAGTAGRTRRPRRIPGRQAREERIVGNSPHGDLRTAPGRRIGGTRLTVAPAVVVRIPDVGRRNPCPKKPPGVGRGRGSGRGCCACCRRRSARRSAAAPAMRRADPACARGRRRTAPSRAGAKPPSGRRRSRTRRSSRPRPRGTRA